MKRRYTVIGSRPARPCRVSSLGRRRSYPGMPSPQGHSQPLPALCPDVSGIPKAAAASELGGPVPEQIQGAPSPEVPLQGSEVAHGS
jgi:hypothetical protein